MKQANDDKTEDIFPGGSPVFELDPEHPWTLPARRPYTPAPRELTLRERMELLVERMKS